MTSRLEETPGSRRPWARWALVLLPVLALCLAVVSPPAAAGPAQPGGAGLRDDPRVVLSFSPPARTVAVGTDVHMDLDYTGNAAWGLYGADVAIVFDQGGLQVKDACPPPYCPGPAVSISWGPLVADNDPNVNYFRNTAYNVTGTVEYVWNLLNPAPPIYGNGVMAGIDFRTTAVGEYCVGFNAGETLLSTRNGVSIPFTVHGACIYAGNPTAVTVASFTARPVKKSIVLAWTTSSESDNLGFNVYRALAADGERVRLNREIIPTQAPPGSPFGATYTFTDRTVKTHGAYYYWLEDVDIYGRRALHGPALASLEKKPLPKPLTFIPPPGAEPPEQPE